MEELFCGAAEELDEQQMIERVLGVLGWAHQPQQPVRFDKITAFEFTVEGFQQGRGVVTSKLIPHWAPIGRFLNKCEYGLSVAMNTSGRGFPIFRMNEIENCFARRPAKYAAIPRSLFDLYSLQENDVLFNRTNSFEFVGRTGIVKDQTDCTFASYLIRLVPDPTRLLPEFLTVYLNTHFGIGQVKRRAMRSINQANVSASEIKKVQIPIFPLSIQEPIAELINSAFLLQKSSSGDYEKAHQLIESELGIDKIDLRKTIGYKAKFGQVETSSRFDAEHFSPEFELLRAKAPASVKFVKLGGDLIYCQRGKQPAYAAVGLPVVNSKHVQPNRVSLERHRTATPNISSVSNIRPGDLLINGTGVGTIGRAAPYLESTVAIPDNHVTIVRTRTLDPVYLSVFLNSQIGQAQVRKHQRGSSGQLELYPRDIARFEVWNAPESIQQEFRQLIVNARDSRNHSRLLLEEAKNRVEELIKQEVKS